MAFKLPDLPYEFNALVPHIDARTMEIHHDKHHATCVAKLNEALDKAPDWAAKSLEEIVRSYAQAPKEVQAALRNHGGGHFNHSLFWKVLSPRGSGKPSDELAAAIDSAFGGFEPFKEKFSAAAAGLFGSGWAWLAVDGSRRLSLVTTPNQNSPLTQGLVPVLGLDVWEQVARNFEEARV